MKLKSFFLPMSILLLADACLIHTLPPAATTNLPASTFPPTIQPTSVPTPAVPSANAPTPLAALTLADVPAQLTTNGPFLAYLRDKGNGPEIVLMDANGKGELTYPFPMAIHFSLPPSLSRLLSPAGTLLAFYTGSAGQAFGQVGSNTADLALNLMGLFNSRLHPGGTQVVTRLLSADYPANFASAASQLGLPDVTAQALQDSFVAGITRSIAWSPDGINLAFAGQMDGLSSDLYLYNAGSQVIQRLSSGPQEVEWIDWSPNGKWILDGSVYFVGEGMTYDVYATSSDGKVTRKLLSDYRMVGEVTWINAQEFLTYQSENGPGNHGLERVNIETGRIDKIWDASFNSFLVDPQGDWLAVITQSGDMVLVKLATLQQTAVSLPGPAHAFGSGAYLTAMNPGTERHFILREDVASGWYYLSTSGALTAADLQADMVSVAPDRQQWIALKDDLQLLATDSTRIRPFALPAGTRAGDIQRIIWRPDSSGIFLVSSSNKLFSLDFSTGEYALVEQYLSAAGPAGLIWVH